MYSHSILRKITTFDYGKYGVAPKKFCARGSLEDKFARHNIRWLSIINITTLGLAEAGANRNRARHHPDRALLNTSESGTGIQACATGVGHPKGRAAGFGAMLPDLPACTPQSGAGKRVPDFSSDSDDRTMPYRIRPFARSLPGSRGASACRCRSDIARRKARFSSSCWASCRRVS